MISLGKGTSVAAALAYFDRHLQVGDYYSQEASLEGVWRGEMAKRFGLEGQAVQPSFQTAVADEKVETTIDQPEQEKPIYAPRWTVTPQTSRGSGPFETTPPSKPAKVFATIMDSAEPPQNTEVKARYFKVTRTPDYKHSTPKPAQHPGPAPLKPLVPASAETTPALKPARVFETIMDSTEPPKPIGIRDRYLELSRRRAEEQRKHPLPQQHSESTQLTPPTPASKPVQKTPTILDSQESESVKAIQREITRQLVEERRKHYTPKSQKNPDPEIDLS